MMRKRNWFAAFALAGMVACGGDADAGADTAADTTTPPPPAPAPVATVQYPEGVTQAMADAGSTTFNTGICVNCHMMNGVGGPLAPALNDTTWINIDGSYEAIVGVIKTGVATPKSHPSPMPPMGGGQFTDEQIGQLAAYVYSLSHGG